MNADALTKRLAGKVVQRVADRAGGSIAMHFTDGSVLVARVAGGGLVATVQEARRESGQASGPRPTPRQREYLAFIRKYTLRFGVPPAEADIERHFLVSAPSVNLMIQTLERRGFLTRARDEHGRTVPRSIRIVLEDV